MGNSTPEIIYIPKDKIGTLQVRKNKSDVEYVRADLVGDVNLFIIKKKMEMKSRKDVKIENN